MSVVVSTASDPDTGISIRMIMRIWFDEYGVEHRETRLEGHPKQPIDKYSVRIEG